MRLQCVVLLIWLFFQSSVVHADSFRIAAASSLQFVLQDIIEEYRAKTNRSAPKIVYGSSGNLYRQIEQGAPYDLFFSARDELVKKLYKSGKSDNSGDQFGIGRLVLLTGLALKAGDSLPDIISQKILPEKQKLAIANPAHAPYGRAAKQVLQSLSLWDATKSNVVNGEQVSQAAQFVVNGAVPYGLVSLSLALSPRVAQDTQYLLIDESLHEPIVLQMVQLATAPEPVEHFYQFVLKNDSVNSIFTRYGLR